MRTSYKHYPAKTLLARLVFLVMSIIPKGWSEFFWYGSVSVIDDVIYLPKGSTVSPIAFEKTVTYRHEMIHVEQRKRTKFWQLRYVLSPRFRVQAEAEAYVRAQYTERALRLDQIVDIIYANYVPLWLTEADVFVAVMSEFDKQVNR